MNFESSKLGVFLIISGAISASSLDLNGEHNVKYILAVKQRGSLLTGCTLQRVVHIA